MTQTALVTGGGRGLGRAFAVALGRAGWKVAVAARTGSELVETVRQIEEAGAEGAAVQADVTDEDQVRSLVETTEARLGGIDLAVNCAGVGGPFGPFHETTAADWWRNLEVNLKGPMLVCRLVAAGMVRRGSGRIVNVASGAGTVSIPYMSAYVTGKAALIRFTEVLAEELRPHGVTAFAIQPGTVRTAMAEELMGSEAGRRWLPWFGKLFEDGQDVSTAPGVELLLRLASGIEDERSGHFFVAPGNVDYGVLRMERAP